MHSKEIPFLRIIVPLCLGITCGLLFTPGLSFIILLIILTATLFILSFKFGGQITNYVYGYAISLAFFSCGLILIKNEKQRISKLDSKPAVFISTLSDFPVEKENSFMATIKLNKIISGDTERIVTGSILIYHKKDSDFRKLIPGDILVVKCTPREITNKGNPDEFNYKSFMASKGIRYFAFTSKESIIACYVPAHRNLVHTALITREKIIDMYRKRGVTDERLPLVSAITLGQKNQLDPETKQIFIKAGIMHIMAVSGLHAVILSLFIFNVLFFFKRKLNFLRIVITILILWAFAFVTGLTPSVLRATLMFTFLQAGNLLNRRVNGINSVLASAFILIILRPSVITDAGFLLSYAAVIYIIGFYKEFYLKIHFPGWLPDKIWESVVVTIVAQAGTLPLTIMLFNRFPVYFILTNVIIVPLTNLLIIIGCLLPLTYSIEPVSTVLGIILDRLTGLVEFLTAKAASLPYSTIDKIGLTTTECLLLSVAITLLMIIIVKKRRLSFKYPLIAFIFFALATAIKNSEDRKSPQLIVYNNPALPSTGIRSGNTLHLLSHKDSIPAEVIRHASTRGLKIKPMKCSGKPVFMKAGNSRIMITDSLWSRWLKSNEIDILVLDGKRPFIEKSISGQLLPPAIIVSSDVSASFILPFSSEQLSGTTIWNVRKSGAIICRL